MNKIYLIFGCHCHQPLGNFERVIDRIYHDAYLAFLELISRHPKIKITLHYSGTLLDWISEKHPEFFKILSGLVKRGQVEMLSGSYYEAILPVIPDRDQVEQVKRLSGFIEKKFLTSPQGMWLAERVWEPKLAKTLAASGMKFALVDDFHFKAAGLKDAELLGYFNVEDEGALFSLFPISEWLRYSIPFKEVEQNILYLRQTSELKENPLLVIVDDGEKFGCWPGTKKWVYEERWLENFLSALEENSSWIETLTCSEYMRRFPPARLAYLPIGAYFEMAEWSLFAERALEYQSLVEKLKQEGLLEKYKGYLKGGIWRNFLIKYPESNQLHKKMVALSQSIPSLKRERRRILSSKK
jgi:alpha-amylase/alpha-mannosidase (GH57 family)